MKYAIKEIGPKEASKLLETNEKNRSIKKVHLEYLTRQMNENKWKENTGESIKISKKGKLLDGQHRLQAVINSGKKLKFLVATDLEEEVFAVIDSGVSRSSGDVLHAMGVHNAFSVAALIRNYKFVQTQNFDAGKTHKLINSEDIAKIYLKDSDKWHLYANRSLQFYTSFNRMIAQSFIGAWYNTSLKNLLRKLRNFSLSYVWV